MSRVLLLNPPGKQLFLRDQYCSSVSKANYYWPPVHLLMQSGIISGEHEVTVLDAIIEKIPEDDCLARIGDLNPQCTVFVTGIASWVEDIKFAEKIKEHTGCLLIASGGLLLNKFRTVMERFDFIDAILMDYTSQAVVDYINGDYAQLHDICYRRGSEIIMAPASDLKEFSIPVPRHDLFPLNKYRLPHGRYRPLSSVLTNFGCPFQCGFCIAEQLRFKYRPVENVIPELDKLVSMGVREIFFKDFTFGIPRETSRRLCEEIISRWPKLSWICSSRVNTLDGDMLRLMKKAGCHTIQFGVESGNQEILDGNNKKITLEQVTETFSLCRSLGIKTLAHFILGLPGETEESLMETIKLARSIDCDYASFNLATPSPGTTLRERCLENNWLASDQEEYDSSRGYPVIETPLLSGEKLWKARNYALRSFYMRPSYIGKKLLGIRSLSDLTVLCREGLSLLGSIRG